MTYESHELTDAMNQAQLAYAQAMWACVDHIRGQLGMLCKPDGSPDLDGANALDVGRLNDGSCDPGAVAAEIETLRAKLDALLSLLIGMPHTQAVDCGQCELAMMTKMTASQPGQPMGPWSKPIGS